MAPYFNLLVSDALKYILDDSRNGITGLIFLDETMTTNLIFANNSILYLVGSKQNLDNIMKDINLFY